MKPDKWAIKEKELYKTEKECFNGWEYDEARAKLDQLREDKKLRDEEIKKEYREELAFLNMLPIKSGALPFHTRRDILKRISILERRIDEVFSDAKDD